MWFQVGLFGHSCQPFAQFNAKDNAPKGMALANKRNALILSHNLKYEVISGDERDLSRWHQIPNNASTQTMDAIHMGFEACYMMSL